MKIVTKAPSLPRKTIFWEKKTYVIIIHYDMVIVDITDIYIYTGASLVTQPVTHFSWTQLSNWHHIFIIDNSEQ